MADTTKEKEFFDSLRLDDIVVWISNITGKETLSRIYGKSETTTKKGKVYQLQLQSLTPSSKETFSTYDLKEIRAVAEIVIKAVNPCYESTPANIVEELYK